MSYSPTYLGDFTISKPTWNTPTNKNKKSEHQHHFIDSAYNRVFFSLKSQHTIFVALLDVVQHFNSESLEDGENGKDKEILSKFKKILNEILNSYYGNLIQMNFAASDLIEKILNPSDQELNGASKHISNEIEKLGYKILSACLSVKRLISILSFTNYISTQLRYSKTEKGKDSNNSTNDHFKNDDPELIEAEDDYQFDTFDSGERASSLGEKRAFPLLSKMQHHKRIHHSKEKNSNHNIDNEKNSNPHDAKQINNESNKKTQNSINNNINDKNQTNNPNTKEQNTQKSSNNIDKSHNLSDQISTEKQTSSSHPIDSGKVGNNNASKDNSAYDNCFHMVDDSTFLDSGSDLNEYYDDNNEDNKKIQYSDEYYSDYYYYDDDEEYDEEPTVICRICEKEVPLSMIEEHSKSCVIAYESSKTMKSTDDHMRKLQAFAQQTVLHVEWPCNEEYAKTVVIPILHVVALLDRAISINPNSNGAPEELDLICNVLNAITIAKPPQNSPGITAKGKTKDANQTTPNQSQNNDTNKTAVRFVNKNKQVPSVVVKGAPLSASTTPTDKQKSLVGGSANCQFNGNYQDALSILSRARALVNEKSSASLSLSAAIDVYKQTTYLGMGGDLDDGSVYIRREVTIADFSFIRRISSGAYAKVYLTRKNQTGDLSATKVIHRDSLRQKNDLQRVMVEKDILAEVSNPFMIRFFFSIIGKNNLYLVMEYCPGGDLYSVLQNIGTFPEDKAWIYTAEVVAALEFLRKKNVIHRDLKPDNILVAANGHLKLTDFGMSAFGIFDRSVSNSESSKQSSESTPAVSPTNSKESDNNNNSSSSAERRDSRDSIKNVYSSNVSLPGTPDYIAPEIILQQPHTFTADYWSLGCIIYELLTGIPPFHGDTPETTFANVVKGVYDESLLLSCDVSDEAVDLIRRLLTRDPKKRLGSKSIEEIKNHPWFSDQGIDWDHLLDMEPPFVPQLANEEDTSYFEERYAMSNDDEIDIREDIEEAKHEMANKKSDEKKKTQSFFNDEKNLFSEATTTSPSSVNSSQSTNNKSATKTTPVTRKSSLKENDNSSNKLSKNTSIINNGGIKNESQISPQNKNKDNSNSLIQNITPKGPMSQPSVTRTRSSMSSNSMNAAASAALAASNSGYHNNSDDELSLFPSCSSGSLQTLTIEDSLKKFRKLQNEASTNSNPSSLASTTGAIGNPNGPGENSKLVNNGYGEYGSKIRVSRSSHNFHRMILSDLKRDKSHQRQSCRNSPDLRHTHSQNIDDNQPSLLDSGSPSTNGNNAPAISSARTQRSKPRRAHVSKYNSSSSLISYSSNYYSENVTDDYSDDATQQSPHFVESKSVSSLQKKWCMTPDGTKKKRRHSHRRSHRGNSRKTSDEGLYSSSSSNLLSFLQNDDIDNDNIHIHRVNSDGNGKIKNSALISDDYSNSFSNSPPIKKDNIDDNNNNDENENKTAKQDYPLSKFVKSDLDEDDSDDDDDDDL